MISNISVRDNVIMCSTYAGITKLIAVETTELYFNNQIGVDWLCMIIE